MKTTKKLPSLPSLDGGLRRAIAEIVADVRSENDPNLSLDELVQIVTDSLLQMAADELDEKECLIWEIGYHPSLTDAQALVRRYLESERSQVA